MANPKATIRRLDQRCWELCRGNRNEGYINALLGPFKLRDGRMANFSWWTRDGVAGLNGIEPYPGECRFASTFDEAKAGAFAEMGESEPQERAA